MQIFSCPAPVARRCGGVSAAGILVPAFDGAELSGSGDVILWEAVPGIAGYEVIVERSLVTGP